MGMPPKYELEVLHSANSELGSLSNIGVANGHIFAAGGFFSQSTFLRTDNAHDFKVMETPTHNGLRGMHVASFDRIYIGDEHGSVFVSTDQGQHWESLGSPGFFCISHITKTDGMLLVCTDVGLYRSRDDGRSWDLLYSSKGEMLGLYADGDRVLGWGRQRELLVLQGGSCATLPLPVKYPPTGVIRTPQGNLMLCGDYGQLLRSVDDGDSWEKIHHEFEGDFEALAVVQGYIMVIGKAGTLLLSDDDGCSFHTLTTSTRATLWSLCPIPGGAYIGGDQGLVMRITLEQASSGTSEDAAPKRSVSGYSAKEPKKR